MDKQPNKKQQQTSTNVRVKTKAPFRKGGKKQNTGYIDPLVLEALDFINKQQDNQTVFGCFHKRNGKLETFGVYNTLTKKHSIHYVTNFYTSDFTDIKVVALAR